MRVEKFMVYVVYKQLSVTSALSKMTTIKVLRNSIVVIGVLGSNNKIQKASTDYFFQNIINIVLRKKIFFML